MKGKAFASGGAAGLQTQLGASDALGSVRLRRPSAGKGLGGALGFSAALRKSLISVGFADSKVHAGALPVLRDFGQDDG
ncbi:hypothetical protein D7S89_17540 [Trinickia fusca]|uniref:Uncharacterized protein n=1 Tax=Trinickia fusca TaxID=2419777 RepID=A0A494XFR6_9BURK|nr:hypothetical protein D7S89_17540 [Trinickia fusca]